jgi:hypothetical protein
MAVFDLFTFIMCLAETKKQTATTKVAYMLLALASNEEFCGIVANELKTVGLARLVLSLQLIFTS